MIITRADLSQLETIMRWRHEIEAWLSRRGSDQWSIPLPRSAMAATIAAGQTWIVLDGDDPVATITLTGYTDLDDLWRPERDPDALWYPEDQPGDALYASKMLVPRHLAGRRTGAEMLDWAGGRAFEAGLTWLRLDAWTTNVGLHDYYRNQGFRHVRTVRSRVSGACFQRPTQPYAGPLKTQ